MSKMRFALLPALTALLLTAACNSGTPVPTATPSAAAPTATTGAPVPTATPTPTVPPTPTATPTPEPVAAGGVLARVLPAAGPLKPGATTVVEVHLTSNGVGISAADVRLTFNPALVEVFFAGPGDVLGANPLVAFQTVDPTAGTVHLAMARAGVTQAASARGVLARLSVRAKDGASGPAAIEISSVAISDHRVQLVTLVNTEQATLQIAP